MALMFLFQLILKRNAGKAWNNSCSIWGKLGNTMYEHTRYVAFNIVMSKRMISDASLTYPEVEQDKPEEDDEKSGIENIPLQVDAWIDEPER